MSSESSSVANFIQKSFQILQNREYQATIHWAANGREFAIQQIEDFQQRVLPKYFRHRNINSFIRQLNMYGFHKSRKDPSKNIFSHPCFLRGQPQILHLVRRKIKSEERNDEDRDFMTPESKRTLEQLDPSTDAHYKKPLNSLSTLRDSLPTHKAFLGSHKESQATLRGSLSIFKEQATVESGGVKSQKQVGTKKEQKEGTKKEQKEEGTKTEMAVGSVVSLGSFGVRVGSPLRGMMQKSCIMESNAELYLKMREHNSVNEIMSEDEDDNLSIEEEIQRERRVFANRTSGVTLLHTSNLLQEFQ